MRTEPISSALERLWRAFLRAGSVKILVVLLAASTAGCGLIATEGKYRAAVSSWVGSDINRVMAAWGAPYRTFEQPNGTTQYVYLAVGQSTTLVGYNESIGMAYGSTNTPYCRTTFVADNSGRVTSFTYQGQLCTSRDE